jgi:hypothetical protein
MGTTLTQQAVTAVGRELLGFIWAIGSTGLHRSGVRHRRRGEDADETHDEAGGAAVEGHTERRILGGHYAPGPHGQTRDASPR